MTTRWGWSQRRGAVMVVMVACAAMVTLMGAILLRIGLAGRTEVEAARRGLQADWLADSGLDLASVRLRDDPAYSGETWEPSAADLGGSRGGRVRIDVKIDDTRPDRRLVRVRVDYPIETTLSTRRTKTTTIELGSDHSGGGR